MKNVLLKIEAFKERRLKNLSCTNTFNTGKKHCIYCFSEIPKRDASIVGVCSECRKLGKTLEIAICFANETN